MTRSCLAAAVADAAPVFPVSNVVTGGEGVSPEVGAEAESVDFVLPGTAVVVVVVLLETKLPPSVGAVVAIAAAEGGPADVAMIGGRRGRGGEEQAGKQMSVT